MEPMSLRTAIILLDRPVVGVDGHRPHERLPLSVRLRATVVGIGPVACTVESDIVGRLAGREEPTWADLQLVWQDVASAIQAKIRAGSFDATRAPHGWRGVHIEREDVPGRPTSPHAAAGPQDRFA
jgi:hypothetical protein